MKLSKSQIHKNDRTLGKQEWFGPVWREGPMILGGMGGVRWGGVDGVGGNKAAACYCVCVHLYSETVLFIPRQLPSLSLVARVF